MRSRRKRSRPRRFLWLWPVLLLAAGAGAWSYSFYKDPAVALKPEVLPAPQEKVPVLMYHSISPGQNLNVPAEDFGAQMKWLHDNGYEPITLQRLGLYWDKTYKVTGKPVVITFDDGYLDNYTAAYPILQKYNFPATIFVITESIHLDNHMKWPQMQEMHAHGIEFGSHTAHHVNFTTATKEQLVRELAESKKTLEAGFGTGVTTFCYPGGGLVPGGEELVKQAGYDIAVTTNNALAGRSENRELLSRVRVIGGMTLDQFAHAVQGAK